METPSINVSRIRLQDSTVLEQRFLAVLRVQNPNAVDLAIEGISYDLEVNGQPFAKGVGKGLVIIPAFSQGSIETEAITTLTGLVRQLREMGPLGDDHPIAYRLTGKVKLRDHPSALPFEMRGDNLWSTRASDTPQPDPTPGVLSNPSAPEASAGSGAGAASRDGAAPGTIASRRWPRGLRRQTMVGFLGNGPIGAPPPARRGPRRSSPGEPGHRRR